jgi:hypothetical protein
MRREEVEIDERYGKEYSGKYVFQEITWAKRSRIIQKHTRYSQQTGQITASDYITIQAETIMASLKEQPANKPITIEKLLSEDSERGLPIELGELFSQTVNKLNTLSFDETAFLSEPYESKNRTQQSQNTDSAKNSENSPAKSEENQPRTSNSSS